MKCIECGEPAAFSVRWRFTMRKLPARVGLCETCGWHYEGQIRIGSAIRLFPKEVK